MRIRYTPSAFADREEIFAYIEKLSPLGAQAVKRDIVRAIRRLEYFPQSAPATDEPGIRQLIVRGAPTRSIIE